MTNKRQAGFTLIELIIFIVVVSAGLAGILLVMNTVAKSSADPMVRKQAVALADSILEEILQKEYADPDGVQGGETTRATMDDVDDYNGKSNALFTDLPAALATYTIGITVVNDAATLGIAAKKATVTITHGTEVITMTGYRSNY
ncbi:MAG: prepilin-type N-terminal cleavage/methylation domain-containing protein [Burkholderiaceae bacterium]|nr:prepilin-type N-terminal cleavage/methylation domain-containing protein [Burkholderiaceae bacterium]